MLLRDNRNVRWPTPPSILKTLLGIDRLEPTNRSQLSCRRIFAVGSFSQLPSWENPHGLVIHPPSRRGHQGQNVQPERSSEPRPEFRCMRSRFRSVDCACHSLTQKPWPSLGSQTSVLRLLAHKPSNLAIQNYNAALCLPSRRKTLPSGATQKPPMRINLLHPKYIGLLGH